MGAVDAVLSAPLGVSSLVRCFAEMLSSGHLVLFQTVVMVVVLLCVRCRPGKSLPVVWWRLAIEFVAFIVRTSKRTSFQQLSLIHI